MSEIDYSDLTKMSKLLANFLIEVEKLPPGPARDLAFREIGTYQSKMAGFAIVALGQDATAQ